MLSGDQTVGGRSGIRKVRFGNFLSTSCEGYVAQTGRLWLRRGKRVAFEAVFVIELTGLVDELDIG